MHPLVEQWNTKLKEDLLDLTPEELKGFRKFDAEDRRYFRNYWKRDPIEHAVLQSLGIDTFCYLGRLTHSIGMLGFPDIIYHRGQRHPERNGYYVRVAAYIQQHVSATSASGFSVSFPRTWASVRSINDLLDLDKLFALTVSLEKQMRFETPSTWDGQRCTPSPQRWWDEKSGPGWFEPGIFA